MIIRNGVKLFCCICIASTLNLSCKTGKQMTASYHYPAFLKEGHRGTRGLMPENTIPAMIKGIQTGANVVEMDIYTTRDGQVLVAHDPFANREHTLLPGGGEITAADAKKYVWHQMDYADIRKLDVGSKYYAAYPQQQKMVTYMPLLGELIDSVEQYTAAHHLPGVIYNIELKSSLKYDSAYNALPADLVKAVMDVVKTKNIGHRFYIQSFDFRPLQEVHKHYPGVTIGFLTDTKTATVEDNLAKLGFVPDIYSPQYKLVTAEMVQTCKSHTMKLVPWTVNDANDIKDLVAKGVNGIITDYPNLFAELGL